MERNANDPVGYDITDEVMEGRKGGAVAGTYPGVTYDRVRSAELGEAAYLGVSRAGWPAVWSGFFIGTMTYLVLFVLGTAIGVSWWRNDDVTRNTLQTAGMIWVIASSLIAFFIGGVVTSRMHPLPGRVNGAMNGLLYGCFSILFFAALSFLPALQGIPTLAALFTQMGGGMNAGMPNMPNVNPSEALAAAQQAAWWGLGGLLLALGAATLGGMCGARSAPVDPLATGNVDHTNR